MSFSYVTYHIMQLSCHIMHIYFATVFLHSSKVAGLIEVWLIYSGCMCINLTVWCQKSNCSQCPLWCWRKPNVY